MIEWTWMGGRNEEQKMTHVTTGVVVDGTIRLHAAAAAAQSDGR